MVERHILTRDDVECEAERVLRRRSPHALEEPSVTPLADIALKECASLGAALLVNQDLGTTVRGERIRGSCRIKKPYVVAISADLDMNGPRFRFTLAHELGHLELHRDIELTGLTDNLHPEEIADDDQNLFQGSRYEPKTNRGWIEWQANTFAAALLMPRATIPGALLAKQIDMGVRRPGLIYVDNQRDNLDTFHALLAKLAELYQVSKTSVMYRVRALNLIIDVRDRGASQAIADSRRGPFRHVLEYLQTEESERQR
jgi:Zn-dependent peptidase ImmA (M78 family)